MIKLENVVPANVINIFALFGFSTLIVAIGIFLWIFANEIKDRIRILEISVNTTSLTDLKRNHQHRVIAQIVNIVKDLYPRKIGSREQFLAFYGDGAWLHMIAAFVIELILESERRLTK